MKTHRILTIFGCKSRPFTHTPMLRYFLIIFLFFSVLISSAQTKLGLKFSPTLTSTRTNTSKDTLDIAGNGSSFRFSLGLVVDYAFTETYTFSTGAFFLPKRVSIRVKNTNYPNRVEEYNLQYIQIPLTLKLYTNEILPDASVFFQVGGAPEIKIFEEPAKEEYTLIRDFNIIDVNVMLGAGVEYKAGINTVLFVDFSFQRGLIHIVKESDPELAGDLSLRNTAMMLNLGIKF
ncbi:MAG: PorT family protein [Saprospiraceae bacterium]|nr:PorT family protein [Saprospiraceae bacterium]